MLQQFRVEDAHLCSRVTWVVCHTTSSCTAPAAAAFSVIVRLVCVGVGLANESREQRAERHLRWSAPQFCAAGKDGVQKVSAGSKWGWGTRYVKYHQRAPLLEGSPIPTYHTIHNHTLPQAALLLCWTAIARAGRATTMADSKRVRISKREGALVRKI